ncbi:MAG TPA: hypothetical protein VJX67_03280, partial [Blastocatellia bacterium]|nr:hypothetical protein [Blastocatellia bacterium]
HPGSISNPQSLNRYSYCVGDPVNGTDPLGLDLWVPSDKNPGCFVDLENFSVTVYCPVPDNNNTGPTYTVIPPISFTQNISPPSIPTVNFDPSLVMLESNFGKFMDTLLSKNCKAALTKALGANYSQKLDTTLASTTFYNTNDLSSQTMAQQFGRQLPHGATSNETVSAFFNSLGADAWVSVLRKKGNGIYLAGDPNAVFGADPSGDMSLLLHELTEERVGGPGDTDQNVAGKIGGIGAPRTGQTWGSVMSNYFNSGCTNTNNP